MKEVGILLKVGAAGLENIDRLGKGLRDAGVDTAELDTRAVRLKAELDALAGKLGTAAGAADQMAAAGADANDSAEAFAKGARDAGRDTQALGKEAGDLSSELDAVGDKLATAASATDTLTSAEQQAAAQAKALASSVQALESEYQGLAADGAAVARGAAEGAAAMRQLEAAAQRADSELQALAGSLQEAEATAVAYAQATDRAAAAGQNDAAANQRRLAAAEALIQSERGLSAAQSQLAAQRDTGRAALVAEAQALLASARAAEESRAATARLVAEARSAGNVLQSAFQQTGVRSLQALEAEIIQTEQAVSLLQRRFEQGAISAADLARAVASAGTRIESLKAEMATLPAVSSQFDQLSARLNGLVSKFGALTAAIAGVGFAVKPVVDASIALEQLQRVLTTVTGSAESAQQQIDFLRRTAQQSGLAFAEIGDAYGKFAASAAQSGLTIQQIESVFGSVALAAGNLGLSSDQARNALNALGQMASKGTVSMEELRQQLGDALPGVLPLLARELGLTQAELTKLVESGQLLASEAIPAIGRSLRALQPTTGVVDGMVASFNRFLNVVKEAGTVLVDGPIGQAAGVVLGAFAGVIRDLSVVAVGASEAFKLLGLSLQGVFAVVTGQASFSELKTQISDFAEQAGDRISKFKETAYGAASAVKGLGTEIASLGPSFSKLALEQQRAVDAAAQAAQAAEKSVAARKAEGAALTTLAELVGDETVKRIASVEAANASAEASRKLAAADEAVVAALTRARDATLAKAAAEGTNKDAIKATVEALNEKIAKATADAEKTRAEADAARAAATAMDLAAEAARDNSKRVDELRKSVEEAEIALRSKVRALRLDATTQGEVQEAALALAKAKGLLRDAIDDVTEALERELKALRADAELQRASLQLEIERQKTAQRRAVDQGNEIAARQAGIRIKEIEQQVDRAGLDLRSQEAAATLRALDLQERELRGLGQLTPQKQAEIEARRKSAIASVLEAQAGAEANRAKEDELLRLKGLLPARSEATSAVDRSTTSFATNTGSVNTNSAALRENAKASDAASSSRSRYDDLLRSTRALGGADGLAGAIKDPRLTGVRDAGGKENEVNGFGFQYDDKGRAVNRTLLPTRSESGQIAPPPGNPADYVFNPNRRGEGPFGLGVWELSPAAAERARTEQAALLARGRGGYVVNADGSLRYVAPTGSTAATAAPAPPPVTTPAPGPQPTAASRHEIVFNLNGQRSTAYADSEAEAQRWISALERALAAGGGG